MAYKPTLPFNVPMKLLIPTCKNVDGERIEMTEEEIQEQYVLGVGTESIIHRTVCFIIAQRVQEIRYINRYLRLLESMWKLLRRVSALLFSK